jgi:arylformamidase
MKIMKIKRVVDLTHKIHTGMMRFNADWHIRAEIRKNGDIASVGRNTSEIIIGSHTGTHIDAARHFIADGEAIDNIPLSKLIGAVQVSDFSHLPRDYALKVHDIQSLAISERVIFNFGWAKYWESDNFYKLYPHFSAEAAQYLVDSGVRLLGMDTPSPDDSKIELLSAEDSKIHKLFLSQGVILIEYLTNLDELSGSGWHICALPLPISGGDGSPARVCAFTIE